MEYGNDPAGFTSEHTFKNEAKPPVQVPFAVARALESMQFHSERGIEVCLLPDYFRTFVRSKFEEILRENDLYVEAIINPPRGVLGPEVR